MSEATLETVIDAVGGSSAFIKALEISPRTLANWRKEGVPDTRWHAVAALAPEVCKATDLALERAAKAPVPEHAA